MVFVDRFFKVKYKDSKGFIAIYGVNRPKKSVQIFRQTPTYMAKVSHIYIGSGGGGGCGGLLQPQLPADEAWYFEPLWSL